MSLPPLTINRGFMAEFLDADPPCFGLGLVEMGDVRCALVALRPEQPIPRHITAGGFAFGHSLLGGDGWEVVHFAFEFYGHATYNALVNPSDPVARAVLEVMVGTGDYFFFAINADRRGATAFRSGIGAKSLAGLKANMGRIRRSTTSEAHYRLATKQFEVSPEPPGTLLTWVCQGNTDHLDLVEDRLVLSPA
jgi:hypothetical protein